MKRAREENITINNKHDELQQEIKNEKQKLLAAENLSESGQLKLKSALSHSTTLNKTSLLEAQALIELDSEK